MRPLILIAAPCKRLEQEVPERLGRMMRWLRHPASRLVRIPVGLLLVLGGVFSILPGLGIWMLPLGLLLMASDVPFLRRPVGHLTIRGADRWAALPAVGASAFQPVSAASALSRWTDPGPRAA